MKSWLWVLLVGCADVGGETPEPDEAEPATTGSILIEDGAGVRRVRFDIVNGRAIYDGCVDIGSVEELQPTARVAHAVPIWVDWLNEDPNFPNQVPYVIDATISPEDKLEIEESIAKWEKQTPLDFCVVGTDCGGMYILFDSMNHPPITTDPTSAFTFKVNTGFRISIPPTKGGAALHEIGHAMGWGHEQRRSDRDDHVTYFPECMDTPGSSAFDKNAASEEVILSPYDLESVMQYSSFSKSIDDVKNDPDGDGIKDACPTLLANWNDGQPHLASFEYFFYPNPRYFIGREIERQEPERYLSIEDINVAWQMFEPKLGSNAANDRLGAAMVSADFDGDGYDDLAVGAPNNLAGGMRSGAVFLYKGTYRGLVSWKVLRAADFGNFPHDGDAFGAALAAYDVDGNGDAELVVGAPGWQVGSLDNAGAIFTYRQRYSGDGNTVREGPKAVNMYTQTYAGFGTANVDDRFGATLAFGKFDGGTPVLLVGVPGETVSSKRSGFVSAFAWTLPPFDVLSPLTGFSTMDTPDNGDLFGSALAVADWNDDGLDDVVVGAPMTGVAGKTGAVYWFAGRAASGTQAPVAARQRVLDPNPLAGGRYGTALAAGSFDGAAWNHGKRSQLAIGAPGKYTSRGKIHIFTPTLTLLGYGLQSTQTVDQTTGGMTNADNDQLGEVLAARDVTNDGKAELFAGLPHRDTTLVDQGTVYLFRGGATLSQGQYYGTAGSLWSTHANDHWGTALALGDFDNDGIADLAGGSDGIDAGGADNAGAISVFKSNGASTNWWTGFDQESSTPE